MKENQILKIALLVISLILGGLIIAYYWRVDSYIEMFKVPMYVMIFALGYILTQIVRRFLFSGKKWWDWFYYIALTAMILPIFFSSPERVSMFNYLTDFGTFFFVIPTLLDGRDLMQKSK
jgi:hypothetical protein